MIAADEAFTRTHKQVFTIGIYNEKSKHTRKKRLRPQQMDTPSKWLICIETKQQWGFYGSNVSHVPLRNKYETQL